MAFWAGDFVLQFKKARWYFQEKILSIHIVYNKGKKTPSYFKAIQSTF